MAKFFLGVVTIVAISGTLGLYAYLSIISVI